MNQYNQVTHLTQDTTWESDRNTIKHNIRESQVASTFPAGDHKAAVNKQESSQHTQMLHGNINLQFNGDSMCFMEQK